MTPWGGESITVRRGGRRLLDAVTLWLEPGKVTGLLGPNGSGKTTLLRVLAGLDRPQEGWVGTAGAASWREPEWAATVSCVLGAVPEDSPFCVEEVLLSARYPEAQRWLDPSEDRRRPLMELLDRLEVFPDGARAGLERAYATLSDGERQLVDLIRGLHQPSPVLLLDEPTSALDVRHRLLVRRVLRDEAARGRTVVLSLHDLAEAQDGLDRAAVLHRGRLEAHGPAAEVLVPELLARVWGVAPEGAGYRLL